MLHIGYKHYVTMICETRPSYIHSVYAYDYNVFLPLDCLIVVIV